MQSSFPREVGDLMVIENKPYNVIATFADVAEQNTFVRAINQITAQHNSMVRKERKIAEARLWVDIMKTNPSLLKLLKDCAEIIALEKQLTNKN
jgi:hypothetical protein